MGRWLNGQIYWYKKTLRQDFFWSIPGHLIAFIELSLVVCRVYLLILLSLQSACLGIITLNVSVQAKGFIITRGTGSIVD